MSAETVSSWAEAGFPLGDPRLQFAIVLDGDVQSAPQMAEGVSPEVGITGGIAIITLGASEDPQGEAAALATVLCFDPLPIELTIVEIGSG